MIENLHLKVSQAGLKKTFPIWVYGETQLFRGSGLYVGHQGVTYNHHFLLNKQDDLEILPGNLKLELFAKTKSQKEPSSIWKENIEITEAQAVSIANGNTGLYFDWDPENNIYSPHLDHRPTK